jgi:hypothetical protein
VDLSFTSSSINVASNPTSSIVSRMFSAYMMLNSNIKAY